MGAAVRRVIAALDKTGQGQLVDEAAERDRGEVERFGEFDDEGDFAETHEINVTPFIDVMLVLLIIFMVAAPLATVDLGVDLPASAVEPQPRPDKPVFVTVKPDLSVAVGEDVIARDALTGTLDTATQGKKDERVAVVFSGVRR